MPRAAVVTCFRGGVPLKWPRVLALAGVVLAGAHAVFAQQSIDYASVSGRVADQSGAVVGGAQVTARQTQTNLIEYDEHRSERPVPISISQSGAVCDHRQPPGVSGCDARPDAHGGRRVRAAGDARGRWSGGGGDRHRGDRGARSRPQPDRRHGVRQRGQEPARSTDATSWRSRSSFRAYRRRISRAPSCSPRPPPFPASACR